MCTVIGYQGNKDAKDILIQALQRTKSRGPDDQRIESFGSCMLGFQRLAIMGLTDEGMQPFQLNQDALVCNGEIYEFRKIKNAYIKKEFNLKVTVIVKSYYICIKNINVRCLKDWMLNLP